MNEPIMLSPHDIMMLIIAVCGAIVTISGAVAVILKLVSKAHEPEKKQNERIKDLEEEVHSIHERLKLGNVRFQSDMERMDKMEKSLDKESAKNNHRKFMCA